MEMFLHSVVSVAIILLLTATGYFCAARGWMGQESKAYLSKFLMSIAIPAMCVYGLTHNLTHEMIASSGKMLLVPLICCTLMFLLSFAAAKLLRLPRKSLGVFMMMASLSNCVFIGYAMCSELFGSVCTPYVMLYYLVSTSFTQLVGLSLIRWSGESEAHVPLRRTALKFIKTPTVIGILIGFVLVFGDIQLPSLIASYTRYMNDIVTPLALLLTGQIIHEIGLSRLRLDRTQGVVMLFRFLIGPGLCMLLCMLLGVDGLARSVFVVEAAMPVVTQTVVASAEYGADETLAAQGAALSTLACFVVIPVLMLLL